MESNSTDDQTEQQQTQRSEKKQPPARQQPQTPSQIKTKTDQTEEKKDHQSSHVDTNLEIISKAVSSFHYLQQYKR